MFHEVKKLDATTALVMFADDLATLEIERCKQRRRSMPFVIMRLADQGASVRQLQIALRALECLDRRFFVHSEHDGVLGWRHVEADDLRGLGRELGVVADAPRLAARKVDLVLAQKAPDILDIDVAKRFGDERSSPVGVAFRRFAIKQGQDAPVGFLVVFRRRAALADFRKTGKAMLGVAHAPFRRRAGRASERATDRPGSGALGRHEHDLRLPTSAMLRSGRARQPLELDPLFIGQFNRRRFQMAAHAALES